MKLADPNFVFDKILQLSIVTTSCFPSSSELSSKLLIIRFPRSLAYFKVEVKGTEAVLKVLG